MASAPPLPNELHKLVIVLSGSRLKADAKRKMAARPTMAMRADTLNRRVLRKGRRVGWAKLPGSRSVVVEVMLSQS